jgi:hypothetical protein
MAAPMENNMMNDMNDENPNFVGQRRDLPVPMMFVMLDMMQRNIRRRRQRRRMAILRFERARLLRRAMLFRQQMAFFGAFLLVALQELAGQPRVGRQIWTKPRLRMYWQSILDGWLWEEVDWYENLCMSRETFFHLCDRL